LDNNEVEERKIKDEEDFDVRYRWDDRIPSDKGWTGTGTDTGGYFILYSGCKKCM
jgi:hypothetical protein